MKRRLLLLCLGGVALLAGVGAYKLNRGTEAEVEVGSGLVFDDVTQNIMQGSRRPDFKIADSSGQSQDVAQWDGKVLVINFWATWCPPCRKEIPMFVDLQSRFQSSGLQVIGIAIDSPNAVQDFLAKSPMNYPVLISEDDGIKVAQNYGNHIGALPYTAVVDRLGHIVFTKPGEVGRGELDKLLLGLMAARSRAMPRPSPG